MKRFALYIGFATTILASCSTKEIDIQTPQQDDVVYYASFEQPSEEGTRVYANEDLLLRWTADDRVSIFNKNTYNQEYRFIGETGDYEGGFNKVGDPEFVTGKEIPHVVSVYPFQRLTRVIEDETVFVTLPSEQSYADNSFGIGTNTMVSVSSDNLLYYKNVGGYLIIKLYGEGVSVSSIALKGNNGERLAGNASVTMPVDGEPTVVMASDATGIITLTCETPVQLGATKEESTQFWFVVPPITFDKGFTISVTKTSGTVSVKSTFNSVAIKRNTLSKMSPMETSVAVPEAIDLGLPSGTKWASFNLGASKPEGFGDYYAWGEIETKQEYSWSTYKWCDGTYNTLNKYVSNPGWGTVDNKEVLDPEDDVALMTLGKHWRMPTASEIIELERNTSKDRVTLNGINGHMVYGTNGNTIFLPATGVYDRSLTIVGEGSIGRYWGNSIHTIEQLKAWCIRFDDERYLCSAAFNRYQGCSIRPVYVE